MLDWLIYATVYLGAALMAYNIYCYAKFIRFVRTREVRKDGERGGFMRGGSAIYYVSLTLLVLFLIGYLAVGLFGKPDLIFAGILFGGSIFVFIMYKLTSEVTQRVIEGEELEVELMAAEETNKAKASFLANVSHEMRTPMNIIIGLDVIALQNPDLPAQTREQLESIGHSARHLLELINNILDINRIDAGELTAKHEDFCLRDMWERLNAIAGTLCENKGLTYDTAISERASGWYVGDEMLLKQVLLSILENAVKYTDAPGTVTFAIDEASRDAGACTVECTVVDTGVGISPDFIDKVFDAFDQEDASSTNRFGGSGLGLAAAKSKVDIMGGTISVSSEKNKGSTFTVTVPLAPSSRQAEVPDQAQGAEDAETLEGKLILIVEDVEESAEIVADLLELEGAESEHAENGQVGLDMFQNSGEFYYDAILMDLRMPVMDGLEATRRIRALDRPDARIVPILALTANAFDSDVKQSLDAGMNVHLVKPTDSDRLYTTLKQLIRQARDQRQEVRS